MNGNDETMNDEAVEPTDDQLAQVPAEKLAHMLREKRRSEGNYRTQLREAEVERDRLTDVVKGYQRARFGELARGRRVRPVLDSALEDVVEKVDVGELLGEDGQLDEEKVNTALDELSRSKPHFFRQPGRSSGEGGSPHVDVPEDASWGDVLGR